MKNISKKAKIFTAIISSVIGIAIFCIWQNNNIVVTSSEYKNAKLPKEFDDFKIIHISDLHNKMFGKNQGYILNKIQKASPDIIVITGDLIDRRRYDLAVAMEFITGAIKLAPVYYVSGNHEAWSEKFTEIKESLTASGVTVLDDKSVKISRGKGTIGIYGLSDPGFTSPVNSSSKDSTKIRKQLSAWSTDEGFKLLLSHRPEFFDTYCKNNMDIVFTGHAHGGQIRIPFIGGLFAPNQGLFPKYTSGSHTQNNTTMFVSRGMGNSVIPIRVFNRPEIVVVTLKAEG